MSFRTQQAIFAAVLLVVATSVATSQSPPFRGVDEPSAALPGPADQRGDLVRSAMGEAADPSVQVGAAGDMIGFSHSDGSGTQTITLVDTGKMWMAVYHVDRSGKIRLVSSRPLDADFSLQLNATSPLPEEIRRIGGR